MINFVSVKFSFLLCLTVVKWLTGVFLTFAARPGNLPEQSPEYDQRQQISTNRQR